MPFGTYQWDILYPLGTGKGSHSTSTDPRELSDTPQGPSGCLKLDHPYEISNTLYSPKDILQSQYPPGLQMGFPCFVSPDVILISIGSKVGCPKPSTAKWDAKYSLFSEAPIHSASRLHFTSANELVLIPQDLKQEFPNFCKVGYSGNKNIRYLCSAWVCFKHFTYINSLIFIAILQIVIIFLILQKRKMRSKRCKWLSLCIQASHVGFEPWLCLFLATMLYCISLVHEGVPKVLAALRGCRAPPHWVIWGLSHSWRSPYWSERTSASLQDHHHHPTIPTLQKTFPNFYYLRNIPLPIKGHPKGLQGDDPCPTLFQMGYTISSVVRDKMS